MPADHDEDLREERLRQMVAELRRPIRLDPALDARVLRALRDEAGPAAPRRRHAWGAGAALAAGLLVAVLLRSPGGPDAGAPDPSPVVIADDIRHIELRLSAPATSVAVVGDFNDWDPAATPLRPTAEQGVWSVELRLKPGRYHYTFLIDGRRWEGDPAEPRVTQSDFGAPVSVLTVT